VAEHRKVTGLPATLAPIGHSEIGDKPNPAPLRRPPVRDLIDVLVSDTAGVLRRLLDDIKGGLLTTVENHATAVTFDDFLDHAAEYLKAGRKDEAAVIAGIVFEDTLRRVCRVREIAERNVPLATLIAQLVKRGVMTELKAKRARVARGLRPSTAHARWEDPAQVTSSR
jgi:hypothetical protein